MSKEEKNRSGLYYVIPACIMDSEDLEPLAKLLYGLLSGLSDGEGICYPSDDYLSKRLRISLRQTQDILKQLAALGLIDRVTKPCSLNPFRKVRYITVYREFKKVIQSHARASSRLHTETPSETAQACDIDQHVRASIESKEIHIESEEEEAPILKTPKTEEKIRFATHVALTQKEYDTLVSEFGQKKIKHYIDSINGHVGAVRGKPYLDDNLTIRNWIRRDEKDNPYQHDNKDIKSFFDRFKEVYGSHPRITIGNDYVEFDCGGAVPADHIKIDENGAQERIMNRLRKWGLSIV